MNDNNTLVRVVRCRTCHSRWNVWGDATSTLWSSNAACKDCERADFNNVGVFYVELETPKSRELALRWFDTIVEAFDKESSMHAAKLGVAHVLPSFSWRAKIAYIRHVIRGHA